MLKNITLDQIKLVNELHIAIQEIYYKNCIRFINSCLFEILNTAIGRFAELGMCKS